MEVVQENLLAKVEVKGEAIRWGNFAKIYSHMSCLL
jgi:hypothetical protein